MSYGVTSMMHSTTNSGIVATESRFWNDPTAALAALNAFRSNPNAQPLPVIAGSGGSGRMQLGNERQFMRSELVRFLPEARQASFNIQSGRQETGRELGGARAFFNVDNIQQPIQGNFGGINSIFVGGTGRFDQSGNSGVRVEGHATFANHFHVNQNSVIFEPDATGEGSLFIGGNFTTASVNQITVNVPAYIAGNTGLQGTNAINFNRGIGLAGNVDATRPINVQGDAYLGGALRNIQGDRATQNPLINGTGTGQFHYTEYLPFHNPRPSNCALAGHTGAWGIPIATWLANNANRCPNVSIESSMNCDPIGDGCWVSFRVESCVWEAAGSWSGGQHGGIHNWGNICANPNHSAPSPNNPTQRIDLHINNAQIAGNFTSNPDNWAEFTPAGNIGEAMMLELGVISSAQQALLNQSRATIAAGGTLPPDAPQTVLNLRSEPQLTLNSVLGENYADRGNYFTLSGLLGGQQDVTTQRLQTAVNNQRNLLPASRSRFQNDHLVIRVTSQCAMNWSTANTNAATLFDGNVMFIVESGAELSPNGSFFNSHPESSTLIYVEPGGRLNNFGSNGLFRGLIYVADSDSPVEVNNTFQWGLNSSIEGGVQIRSGVLNWNSGGQTVIRRDQEVLNNFGFLVNNQQGGQPNGDFILGNMGPGVILSPVGFYFR
jgi:hypothetical protein